MKVRPTVLRCHFAHSYEAFSNRRCPQIGHGRQVGSGAGACAKQDVTIDVIRCFFVVLSGKTLELPEDALASLENPLPFAVVLPDSALNM